MRVVIPTREIIQDFLSCTSRMENLFFEMESIIEEAVDIASISTTSFQVTLHLTTRMSDAFYYLNDLDISNEDKTIFINCLNNLICQLVDLFLKCGLYKDEVIPLSMMRIIHDDIVFSDERSI